MTTLPPFWKSSFDKCKIYVMKVTTLKSEAVQGILLHIQMFFNLEKGLSNLSWSHLLFQKWLQPISTYSSYGKLLTKFIKNVPFPYVFFLPLEFFHWKGEIAVGSVLSKLKVWLFDELLKFMNAGAWIKWNKPWHIFKQASFKFHGIWLMIKHFHFNLTELYLLSMYL